MRYLSLFSGLEAAHLALSPLGWECVGVAEIDAAACALLRHRLPHVPNLGNVTEITDAVIAQLGAIDVVIGGSPCQDLSVAGKRAGLAGARSSLFHEQLRIFHAARTFCSARWLWWENVPGAFSSNKGRDFAVVVGALAGCEFAVPADGWKDEGVALGDNGLVEWSVLDAQWFGVAQQRRRVFAVLDVGNWTNRPPVLLEPDRLRGDSAPRRQAGESVAGTIAGGARQRGGYSNDNVPLIAGTLQANGRAAGSVTQQDAHAGMLVVQQAFGGGANCNATNVSTALTAHPGGSRLDFLSETFLVQEVAHTLRADGFDASEDGTGRGTPIIPVPASQTGMQVRRLTPTECERLQGVPDGWTLVPNARGKPMADGPRYKMLGNSFAVPVIRWIGEQIQAAHACEIHHLTVGGKQRRAP
ncbi:DNA cytosine methyltransferase [Xanthomonas albilineans]|nr:DNA cytosine methyltransferase [Xanthomonas albilineans]